jgi:hypothetical protein
MPGLKRPTNDENVSLSNCDTPLEFRDGLKRRRKTVKISEGEVQVLRDQRAVNDARVAEERKEALKAHAEAEKERLRVEENNRLRKALDSVSDAGYTLYEFLDELMNTRDRATSSQVSQMLIAKGGDLLESIRRRQPKVVHTWAAKTTTEVLARESSRLAEHLRPQQNCGVTNVLLQFLLERIMSDAEKLAPTLCELLRSVGTSMVLPDADRKDRDLVYIFFRQVMPQN